MSKRKAKQSDFDQMVDDLIKQEVAIHNACLDTVETLERSNYDLSNIYLYRNEQEYQEKLRTENRCKTIESIITNSSYLMNLSFAIKGLIHTINSNTSDNSEEELSKALNAVKLLEGRKLFSALILVLPALSQEDEEEEEEEEFTADAKDSKRELEEDPHRQFYFEIFSFLNLLLLKDITLYQNYEQFFEITADHAAIVVDTLERQFNDARLVEAVLEFILLSSRTLESNKTLFRRLLFINTTIWESIGKFYSEQSDIIRRVDLISQLFQK